MTNCPLVSVLIPCYNHEQFLDDCLTSILAQDYPNMELLICDDASPDRSFEIIQSYRERLNNRFSHVEIMRNETNCGVTCNINRMLKVAKGVFVKILASDDAMSPNAIRTMATYLLETPEVDVVVSNGIKVSEKERYLDFGCGESIYPEAPDFSADSLFERVAVCNPISAPAAMVRMSVYMEHGLYDETIKVEDYEFWLRILRDRKAKFGFVDQKLIYYRINENSMTSMRSNAGLARRRKLLHESEIRSLNKYRKYFQKEAFSEIVLMRIHSERCLAVEYKLNDWETELREEWRKFDGWKDLPIRKRLFLRLRSMKQYLKKLIRS